MPADYAVGTSPPHDTPVRYTTAGARPRIQLIVRSALMKTLFVCQAETNEVPVGVTESFVGVFDISIDASRLASIEISPSSARKTS